MAIHLENKTFKFKSSYFNTVNGAAFQLSEKKFCVLDVSAPGLTVQGANGASLKQGGEKITCLTSNVVQPHEY